MKKILMLLVHVHGYNASRVLPAKFVVFLVKNKGVPFFIQTPDAFRSNAMTTVDKNPHAVSTRRVVAGVSCRTCR